jgi:hypothetical protein
MGTWTLRKVYQKYPESFKIWCWKTMDRVKEERNILHSIRRRKSNWTGHSLRRNCLLKHVTDEGIEGRSDGKTRNKT